MTDSEQNTFQLGAAIPVIRMLDEASARKFYFQILDFVVDWEHRFRDTPESPLYMQVSWQNVTIHLNGHAEEDSPVAEVRIPVDSLTAFCSFVNARLPEGTEVQAVDPRYTGSATEVNLRDPSGNMLVFWQRTITSPED